MRRSLSSLICCRKYASCNRAANWASSEACAARAASRNEGEEGEAVEDVADTVEMEEDFALAFGLDDDDDGNDDDDDCDAATRAA